MAPYKTTHQRIRLLGYICLAIMVLFIVRLFYLQVIRHDYYVDQAKNEQQRQFIINASRGEIYVMDGDHPVKFVLNQAVYTVFVDPSIVAEPEKVVTAVREIAGGNARPHLDTLVHKNTRYEVVATKVSRTQAELLKKKQLKGLGFQATTQRVYPEGKLAAQTLGFVNAEGKGQYGIEGYFDSRLQGKNGLLKTVTDISNVPLTIGRNAVRVPARNGDNIALSIDRNIQSYTEAALAKGLRRTGATKASAIVMDPQTGRVLAMANLPTYNPAEFTKVTDGASFSNAVVASPYEAGSVFKTFTVATGVDKGAIRPDATYVNTDYIQVEDRTIVNALKGHTGTITIQEALNWSLNTGMVTVAQRLGDGRSITRGARDTIYHYYHDKFGLGTPTGIEVSGEAAGRVISPKEDEGNAVRYSNMVFGQGLDVTMIQVASGFCAMVNGGTYYQPTVVRGIIDQDGHMIDQEPKAIRRNVVSKTTSDTMRHMTHEARNVLPSGDRPGYYIGGKTGTSQTIENGQYVLDQTIATYLGYGGTEQTSRYVIMVQVAGKRMNLEGGTHAKPIFTDISNWMIDYLKLQPKE